MCELAYWCSAESMALKKEKSPGAEIGVSTAANAGDVCHKLVT
jgi:hypothetical protein